MKKLRISLSLVLLISYLSAVYADNTSADAWLSKQDTESYAFKDKDRKDNLKDKGSAVKAGAKEIKAGGAKLLDEVDSAAKEARRDAVVGGVTGAAVGGTVIEKRRSNSKNTKENPEQVDQAESDVAADKEDVADE